jgi:uncharacterized membrane protein
MSDKTVQPSSVVGVPSLAANGDIAAAVAIALLGAVVLSLRPGLPFAVRAAIVVPLVLFVPGYVIVGALFPAEKGVQTARVEPSLVERFGLALGLSIFVVPVIGVVVDALLSLTLVPVLDTIAAVTIAAGVIALVRRAQLAPAKRFHTTRAIRTAFSGARERPLTQLFLIGAVLLSVVAIGASGVVATTGSDDSVTQFYLTTEGPDGGQLMATAETIDDDSTQQLTVESPADPLGEYTIVARTGVVADGDVTEQRTVGQTTVTLGENGTATTTDDLELDRDGRPIVLTYLLYEDEPADTPTRENAVRWLRVRIR